MSQNAKIQPRILRFTQALDYCSVSERVFNKDFRPHLSEVKVGTQGVGFDRLEVDSFLTWKFENQGIKKAQGSKSWRNAKQTLKGSTLKTANTSSIKSTKKSGFLRELELVINNKR